MTAPRSIKLFGERNTGTRVLQKLLADVGEWLPGTAKDIDAAAYGQICTDGRGREAAIDAIFADAGDRCAWKHCATDFADLSVFRDCLVLFTVRHPASWLVGLFGNPYHALSPLPRTMHELVEFEWETVGRERLGGRRFRPLELLNCKLRSYGDFAASLARTKIPFRFVRFEDVVLQQEAVFRAITADLGKPAAFEPLQQSTKDPKRSLADYQQRYGQEQWRAALAGLEDRVNEQVDWSLASEFGYAPL